mmetsp:Transcript_4201/g.3082  ORF Transcript_4201/g.3082 Transcript_4201/m.3082 type:complete len:81 (-) Transcript_4201:167-409(-)
MQFSLKYSGARDMDILSESPPRQASLKSNSPFQEYQGLHALLNLAQVCLEHVHPLLQLHEAALELARLTQTERGFRYQLS